MKFRMQLRTSLGLILSVVLPLAACSGGGSTPLGAAGVGGGAGTSGSAGTTQSAQGGAGGSGPSGGSGAAGSGSNGGASGTAGAPATAGTSGAAGDAGGAGGGGSNGAAGTGGSTDGGSGTDARTPFAGTAKIMVVGSSNELGTCWRAFLWQELRMNGIMNFDFVGQQNGGPNCGVMGWNDTDLQAQSGMIVTGVPASTYAGWFKANRPDFILQHFGGADILAGKPVDGVMKSYQVLLDQARLANPNVVLLIAQHTPEGKADIVVLNADIAAWAPTVSTAQSPVVVVDLYTGMLPSDFSDGVHLNATGAMKVADRWYAALKPFFK
jgi:hypothetical protein